MLTLACLAAVVVAGLVTYGYTLHLPLFWDDLWMFKHVLQDWHSVLTGWRPLTYGTYKLLANLQGQVNPFGQHTLALALHLSNGCLWFGIISLLKLPHRRLAALACALLFVLYPFCSEAVTWVAALTHPLMTTFVLGAVLFYQFSRVVRHGGLWLRLGSITCAMLAPLANEAGVVVFALLALLLWAEGGRGRAWLGLLPYLLCAAVGYIAQRLVLPSDGRISPFAWQDWALKVPYLLQVLSYPFAPFVTWLHRRGISLNPFLFSALIYAVLLLVYLWLIQRLHLLRYALLSCGWFAIACAPAAATMNPGYLLYGPRLLYLAGGGAALLWALPLAATRPAGWRGITGFGLAAALALGAALSGLPFLAATRAMSVEIGASVAQLKISLTGKKGHILSLDYPYAFGLKRSVYLLGGYSPALTGSKSPTDLSDLLFWNGAPGYQLTNYTLKELAQPSGWKFEALQSYFEITPTELQPLLRQQRYIYTVRLNDTISLLEAGNLEASATQSSSTYTARFGELIALLDFEIVPEESEWQITLRWQCWQPPDWDTMVLMHIYDSAGKLVSVQDAYPLLGMSWPQAWQAGDIWRDVRYLRIPPELAPGEYTVTIGLYYPGTNTRSQAYDQVGQRYKSDEVVLGMVTVP